MLVTSIFSFSHNIFKKDSYTVSFRGHDCVVKSLGNSYNMDCTGRHGLIGCFFSIIGWLLYSAMLKPTVQNSKKILLFDGRREIFNFCGFDILVKLHDFVCRPHRVMAEILIKINKHIYPRIHHFAYILPQIKPTLEGPQTVAFSKYFSDYNSSSRCIYQIVLIELRLIRMLKIS